MFKKKKRLGRKHKSDTRKKRKIVREILQGKTSLRKLGQKYNLSHQTISNIIKNYSPDDPIKVYKKSVIPRLTNHQKHLRLD